MKKLLSLLLALILTVTMLTPAASAVSNTTSPIVILRGDGVALSMRDENGKETEIWPLGFGDFDGKIGETAKNILIPFLTEGLLFDKWDNYYKVCYEELSPIMKDVVLDNNGEPLNNSGIVNDYVNSNKSIYQRAAYGATDYTFYYDWRLSPYSVPTEAKGTEKRIVDLLHDYIKEVSRVNGGKKVTLAGNCLGGSYVLAYLKEYGDEGLLRNVFFNSTVGNSTAILTDVFCGDIKVDAKGLQRFADEYIDADADNLAGILDTAPAINSLITTTLDLCVQLGILDMLGKTIDDVYQKVYEVLVPMLVIAFYGTMPGYWTIIEPERLDEAINFVFGPEGSEYRTEYAGVIKKIEDYFDEVGNCKYDIIEACQQSGIRFGATAKYGVQMYPFVESQNELSDEMADLYHASFGATVAETVYDVLPTERIDAAFAEGKEKYISPDKQIDASTSLFKDTIWFEKNMPHNAWEYDYKVIEAFAANDNFTVDSDPNLPQFAIRIPGTGTIDPDTCREDPETSKVEKMTAENCNISNWNDTSEDTKTNEPTVATKLMAFFRWLTAMIKFILHITNDNPGSLEDAIN